MEQELRHSPATADRVLRTNRGTMELRNLEPLFLWAV